MQVCCVFQDTQLAKDGFPVVNMTFKVSPKMSQFDWLLMAFS